MHWSWVVIVLGGLVILSRAPLIFAPEAVLSWSERTVAALVRTNLRVRFLGLVYFAFAAVCIRSVGEPETGFFIVQWCGWLFAIAGVWTLATPSHFRGVIGSVFELMRAMPLGWIRGLGALAVAIGVLLIHLGVQAL